jgi:hypothetical protein
VCAAHASTTFSNWHAVLPTRLERPALDGLTSPMVT